jgi:hypothetical protein
MPKKSTVDGAEIAPLLEDGKVYYWQVWGYINTSHGDELVKGTLTQFQYFEYLRGIEYIGLTDEDKKNIKDALIVLLQKLVDKKAANSIENYDVNRVVLDNSPVTREEIMTVLQAIIDDKLTATSIRLQ